MDGCRPSDPALNGRLNPANPDPNPPDGESVRLPDDVAVVFIPDASAVKPNHPSNQIQLNGFQSISFHINQMNQKINGYGMRAGRGIQRGHGYPCCLLSVWVYGLVRAVGGVNQGAVTQRCHGYIPRGCHSVAAPHESFKESWRGGRMAGVGGGRGWNTNGMLIRYRGARACVCASRAVRWSGGRKCIRAGCSGCGCTLWRSGTRRSCSARSSWTSWSRPGSAARLWCGSSCASLSYS